MDGTQRLEAIELIDVLPEERAILLTAKANAMTAAVIDRASVGQAIKGKPTELASVTLAQTLPLATLPDIRLGPEWMEDLGWLERVPWLSLRILVHVKQAAPEHQVLGG
jgi:hypothetical protein